MTDPPACQHSPPTQFPFLRLPLDLREAIYALLLLRGTVIIPWIPPKHHDSAHFPWEHRERLDSVDDIPHADVLARSPGILRVSKQVSTEALEILYGRSPFLMRLGGSRDVNLAKVGPANLARIRQLRVLAEPLAVTLEPPLRLHAELWVPLLRDLSLLSLVLVSPRRATSMWTQFSWPLMPVDPGDDLRKYLQSIEKFLAYLAANIEEPTRVEADVDALPELSELLTRHFGDKLRHVKTRDGDQSFRRASFSDEYLVSPTRSTLDVPAQVPEVANE